MARPVRIHIPNATYVIQLRSRDGISLFTSERDRELFLKSIGEAAKPFGVKVYAFSLMESSALLFLKAGQLPLSKFVHKTQSGYFNRLRAEHGFSQKIIQDRHRAILVEDGELFSTVVRRIHLAPIIGGHWSNMSEARKWGEVSTNRWTSFSIFTGKIDTPHWFDKGEVLRYFEDSFPGKPEEGFYRYVIDGVKKTSESDVFDKVKAMCLLGSDEFVKTYYRGAKGTRKIYEISKGIKDSQSQVALEGDRLFKKIVEETASYFEVSQRELLKPRVRHLGRKFVIELALKHAMDAGGVKKLGNRLGVSGSALAHLHRNFEKNLLNDAELSATLSELEKKIIE